MEKKVVCIVTPVYNEQSVLPFFFERMARVMDGLADRYNLKVICVDDGSRDKTWQMIREYSQKDERFSGIRLSRNFGHQAAFTCGYEIAPGDALISIDLDLQDPPEVIPEMLQRWEEGSQNPAEALRREER